MFCNKAAGDLMWVGLFYLRIRHFCSFLTFPSLEGKPASVPAGPCRTIVHRQCSSSIQESAESSLSTAVCGGVFLPTQTPASWILTHICVPRKLPTLAFSRALPPLAPSFSPPGYECTPIRASLGATSCSDGSCRRKEMRCLAGISEIMSSGPIISWQMGKQWKQWQTLFSWAPKSLKMVTAVMKLKDACSSEEKLWPT